MSKGRARSLAVSSGANPPSGPIRIAQGPGSAPASKGPAPAMVSSQNMIRRVASQPESTLSSRSGAATSGTESNPHCSAASIQWARSRVSFTRSELVNLVKTGQIRVAPISAAFSTIKSVRAFLIGAKSSQRSGGSFCSRVCSSQVISPPRLLAETSRARHSPSRPLKSSASPPSARRITLAR